MSNKDKKKVLVGMSGGVDSSAVIRLLQDGGYEVAGVHLIMNKKNQEAAIRAKDTADILGIDFFVKDISDEFEREVIDVFIDGYQSGITPNPCVVCNPGVKFAALFREAKARGFEFVATGHYAKIEETEGSLALKKAKDLSKDQSYFLYGINREDLSKVLFPLGDFLKKDVKTMAEKLNLPAAKVAESQDICFFGKGDNLERFIESRILLSTGDIVDESGVVLGRHRGALIYTLGQRYGLGISGGPYYVIDKDLEKNIVIVSKDKFHKNLIAKRICFDEANWVFAAPEKGKKYDIKNRYRSVSEQGVIYFDEISGLWVAEMERPQWAITAGQSLVVYDGDIVLGGGVIKKICD